MFELKPLSREGVDAALERARHYRLLNEPRLAGSICLDVLEVVPDDQRALVILLLARTDQFGIEGGARVDDARSLLPRITDEYRQTYYAGIICERWAEALLEGHTPGSGPIAHDALREAMGWYEKAEAIRPAGDDDPILRWNTCVRIIRHYDLKPQREDGFRPLLE